MGGKKIKPIIETSRFQDASGRLMLRVRFIRNSNFWPDIDGATWVPTFEELYLVRDALDAINDFNEKKKTFAKHESSDEVCKCGHSRAEHFDFIDRIDSRRNKSYRQWVAKGLGKCLGCSCAEFKRNNS